MQSYVETIQEAQGGEIQLHKDKISGNLFVLKKMNVDENEFSEIKISLLLSVHPHPNIIQFEGCHYRENDYMLQMEHCSGGDLFTLNEEIHSYRIPEPMLQRLFTEIVSGISHLHSLDIAHRDISLENVLLDERLQCHLCDFGLAAQNASVCHGVVGKLFYMAPEVISASSASYDGFKADIWSLGVLLFIMLTGVNPFQVANSQDLDFQILEEQSLRALLALYNTEVPETTVDLLEQLLVCIPNQRFSIEEVEAHPFFQQQAPSVPRSRLHLLFQNNIPCSSCPKPIHIGHRKHTCRSCNQILCPTCHKQHVCRFS